MAIITIGPFASAQEARPGQLVEALGNWESPKVLADVLRGELDLPAVAIGFVSKGKLVEQVVDGVRRADRETSIREDDRFHLGSVSKSVTASMLGRLIEEGVLDWSTTIGEVLPEFEMREEYRAVTVEQLLQHRGGIRLEHLLDRDLVKRVTAIGDDSTAQREVYVEDILKSPSVGKIGTESMYSNAGYAVAAYLGEVRTGESWEELVKRTVFKPLGMSSGSFGWPVTPEDDDAANGHFGAIGERMPQEPGDYDLGKFWRPAGDVACSLGDFAKYAAAHLAGLRGEDGFLSAATVKRLHTPLYQDKTQPPYAAGWTIMPHAQAGEVHWHNGSAGTYLAEILLFPSENAAIVLFANAFDGIEIALEHVLLTSMADHVINRL